jgi:hypothetical protein
VVNPSVVKLNFPLSSINKEESRTVKCMVDQYAALALAAPTISSTMDNTPAEVDHTLVSPRAEPQPSNATASEGIAYIIYCSSFVVVVYRCHLSFVIYFVIYCHHFIVIILSSSFFIVVMLSSSFHIPSLPLPTAVESPSPSESKEPSQVPPPPPPPMSPPPTSSRDQDCSNDGESVLSMNRSFLP